MKPEDKKAVTEWCRHELDGEGVPYNYKTRKYNRCLYCGFLNARFIHQHENRTFKEWDDFGACYERLVALGEWEIFYKWGLYKYPASLDEVGTHGYNRWLLSRTDSGHFRLCALIAEALKEGGLK